ncbi:hypothetical protein ACFFQF_28690 [Haladaptatus pallidirubidus]|uniref:Uncharacterized protein n=1 Tax=Haladaptatus pallidirubidus TaxID=1008152 RepID=A0AAV3UJN4_9EURY|nr:hypothetical protein [Haladaptatus pallidirubidus]
MADTKKSRNKQARDEENRQRAWEVEQARERIDETEPRDQQGKANETQYEEDEYSDSPHVCHRRECDEIARFVVLERYQEETGHGTVKSEAKLCRKHTAEESPTNLDDASAEYLFRVDPLPETADGDPV